MADELTIKTEMSFLKTPTTEVQLQPDEFTVDVTGGDFNYQTQSIATSAEAIALGDITTPGYMIVHNTDDTNYVEIGYDDSGFKPTVKLLGGTNSDGTGDWAIFRHTQAAPQAQANTAACVIEYLLIEA